MTFKNLFCGFGTAACIASAAFASGPGTHGTEGTAYLASGVMTYEVFEASVAHADLASCPTEFDP